MRARHGVSSPGKTRVVNVPPIEGAAWICNSDGQKIGGGGLDGAGDIRLERNFGNEIVSTKSLVAEHLGAHPGGAKPDNQPLARLQRRHGEISPPPGYASIIAVKRCGALKLAPIVLVN